LRARVWALLPQRPLLQGRQEIPGVKKTYDFPPDFGAPVSMQFFDALLLRQRL
jgi:hypothetical protein